jgi:hypothetical protein
LSSGLHHASSGAFSGYPWPAEVLVMVVRWCLSYSLSARQITELLAERGINVSAQTVLTWTQTFGPRLATGPGGIVVGLAAVGYIDEVFLFHGAVKRYLYRAVDEYGQVVDILLRERRNLASDPDISSTAPGRPKPERIESRCRRPAGTTQRRSTCPIQACPFDALLR